MPGTSRRSLSRKERAIFERLSLLRQHREPFDPLARALVEQALGSLPWPPGPIVEIGAGDGQLRAWLPPALRDRVIHTEPHQRGLERMQRADAQAQVRQATAEQLPWGDGEVAGIVGLCVLDTVRDGEAVAREAARVLAPGGFVAHLLDMSPEIGPALRQLSRSEILPLPNVFTDPCASAWPDDLFLVPRPQIAGIIELLRGDDRPGGRILKRYHESLTRRPFSTARAADAFNAINNDPQVRQAFRELFRDAMTRASPQQRAALAQYEGRPVSSARFVSRRLREWFGAGFRVEHDDVLLLAACQPRPEGDASRYLSRVIGHTRTLPQPPSPCLAAAQPPPPGDDERLLELGMHAFIARRASTR